MSLINLPGKSLEGQIRSPLDVISGRPQDVRSGRPQDGQIEPLGDVLGEVLGKFWVPIFAGWEVYFIVAERCLLNEYMDNWEKFKETLLPKKDDFYSPLDMEVIADADYTHADIQYSMLGYQ